MKSSTESFLQHRAPVVSCLLALCLALPVQAATRGLSAEDLVTLDRVSTPLLSPDGSQVAFLVRHADLAANSAVTSLWLQAFEGGEPRRLTAAGESVGSPSWSVDGRSLFYLSSSSGSRQVWRLGVAGGEPQRITDYPLDVGTYRLSPDGMAIAFSLEVFPDCEDLACSRQRLDSRAEQKATGVLYEQLFIRHWDQWKDGRLNQLFVSRLDGEGMAQPMPKRVSASVPGDVPSKPFGGVEDYVWSPDGQSLVFSARLADRSEAWSTNFDLYQVAFDGSSAARNLTADNPAMDTGPVFSADGHTLYYRAMSRPGFEADRLALMALNLADGSRHEIAPDWDRSAYGITLSTDGRRIYTTAFDIGQRALFAIDIDGGKATRIAADGSISAFDLHGDRLVFARDTLTSPARLYTAHADGSGQAPLADFNAARLADVGMGDFAQFRFPGHEDTPVYGYVVRPWNYKEGRRYPVAFIVHGGPQGSMGNSFHYRWNPQTYAAQGWAVVFIDFHGSVGYGQAFTDSISGDWGGKPLVDLQKGWRYALDTFDFLDGSRACALGASYGGYMINWIAGNWNEPWSCLVSHSGVFDLRMMGYATEELWFTEWENGGTPWQVPANYERHNPVNHVDAWRVPMLVIHGQRDYRVLVEQGIATFTALQRRGIDSQFLYFPDENHWILKPQNSVQWHDTVNGWLRKHFE
jgi:dipeptidyl aminopeptidase/acylaminoacyl peptidase